MDKLIEIAKECGADFEFDNFDYGNDSSPSNRKSYLTFTPDQLRATVEQVCAPLVEALGTVGKTEYRHQAQMIAEDGINLYRTLIGDKE